MKTKMNVVVILASLVALGLAASSVRASSEHTVAAVTCVPDDGTSADRYNNALSTITFQGATTGFLQFYCPVTNPMDGLWTNPEWDSMYLTNSDNSAASYVRADLLKKRRTTGFTSRVARLDSTDNPSVKEQRISIGEDMNFNDYAYFIVVTLYRSVSTVSPAFHSVALGVSIE